MSVPSAPKPPWWQGSLRPRPVDRLEIAAMRLLFIGLVNWKMIPTLPYPGQPVPVGLANWIDLSGLGRDGVLDAVRVAIFALSIPYILGRWLPAVIPLIAFLHIAIFTFYNSQGFINHTWQIISLILLAQALAAVFPVLWRALARRPFPFRAGCDERSLWLYFSQGAIAVSYVTSAVSKMVRSEGHWLASTRNLPVELLRTQMQGYYSMPVAGPPPEAPPMAQWLIDHPGAAIWLFGPGFFLELFAFVGLWNRVFAFWTGVALIVMHRLIALIMDLHFELNEWVAFIFFVNLPWWAIALWRRVGASGPSARPVRPT